MNLNLKMRKIFDIENVWLDSFEGRDCLNGWTSRNSNMKIAN